MDHGRTSSHAIRSITATSAERSRAESTDGARIFITTRYEPEAPQENAGGQTGRLASAHCRPDIKIKARGRGATRSARSTKIKEPRPWGRGKDWMAGTRFNTGMITARATAEVSAPLPLLRLGGRRWQIYVPAVHCGKPFSPFVDKCDAEGAFDGLSARVFRSSHPSAAHEGSGFIQ